VSCHDQITYQNIEFISAKCEVYQVEIQGVVDADALGAARLKWFSFIYFIINENIDISTSKLHKTNSKGESDNGFKIDRKNSSDAHKASKTDLRMRQSDEYPSSFYQTIFSISFQNRCAVRERQGRAAAMVIYPRTNEGTIPMADKKSSLRVEMQ
jgi:hypothetical protein